MILIDAKMRGGRVERGLTSVVEISCLCSIQEEIELGNCLRKGNMDFSDIARRNRTKDEIEADQVGIQMQTFFGWKGREGRETERI